MVCVRDFRDLCPRLSPQGGFGESQHNGIWVLAVTPFSMGPFHLCYIFQLLICID